MSWNGEPSETPVQDIRRALDADRAQQAHDPVGHMLGAPYSTEDWNVKRTYPCKHTFDLRDDPDGIKILARQKPTKENGWSIQPGWIPAPEKCPSCPSWRTITKEDLGLLSKERLIEMVLETMKVAEKWRDMTESLSNTLREITKDVRR